MNCKTAELYMNALIDNELPVKDGLEILDHIENCPNCKSKWELSEETKSKLKHFVGSIKASTKLRKKIASKINGNKVSRLKPMLIAASIAFLIGLGLFNSSPFAKVPPLSSLHSSISLEIKSNNIDQVSKYIGANLKDSLSGFIKEDFEVEGALKLNKLFNKVSLVSLKNNLDQKISICFLPKNYKLSMCHTVELNGLTFQCGESKNCHFAYWKQNGETIAVVSDSFTPEEIIKLALPLTKSSF